MDCPETIGALSVDEFMRRHWQRAPCLLRAAFPAFVPPLDIRGLFALAARDDVESRLIAHADGKWSLRHGPFTRLPPRRRPGWTLLVQGTDLHDDAMHALMGRFRFIPDARVDDLMVSFATDTGGVGPHVDQYDVFLLQAHGRRRWRIAPPGDATPVPGFPVKRLARFEPTQEWVLDPGDMLYLPPGWGHDGVAIGEGMTYSIGFRAPSRQEFLSAFLAAAADAPGGVDPRFGDRGRIRSAHPGQIPADLAKTLEGWAHGWRPTHSAIRQFIGTYLTEPKPTVWFDPPEPAMSADRWALEAVARGVRLDRRTRMAWLGPATFVNGEPIAADAAVRRWLRRLADRRHLDAPECAKALADPGLTAILASWYDNGWLRLAATASPCAPTVQTLATRRRRRSS